MKIWFATNNAHKKEELEKVLNVKLFIPSQEGIKFNPDETGRTFSENSLIKARELKKLLGNSGDLVIADDSGLCVNALEGRPGVFSARYGEKDGKKLASGEQNLLLIDELGENQNRSARFVCAMTVLRETENFIIVQETLEGEIVRKSGMKGDGGFGYDPIFWIPSLGRTLAELSMEEKNTLSHRGKAGKVVSDVLTHLNK
ncbi:RdgB/HAM1 family non-canonical purine NTP pyrophosphatase [Treponema sp. R6D11]